jgi:hypothetical protein
MTLTDVIAKVTRYAKRVIVTDNSSSDAVRITQTGSGNALVVEDSASPDATPFVIKSDGKTGIGTLNPDESLDVNGSVKALFAKINRPNNLWQNASYYGTGGVSGETPVGYGALYHHNSFQVNLVSNGYRNNAGTWTTLNVDGNTGAAIASLDPRGRISFGTEGNKPTGSSVNVTTRVTIDQSGFLGVGTVGPLSELHVDGDITLSSSTTATTVGLAGPASALPATPTGYLVVRINGVLRKIPFFNV